MFFARSALLLCAAVVVGMAQNSTAPQFGTVSYYQIAGPPNDYPNIAIGDVNGDGYQDVVVMSSQLVVSVLLGNGTGTFPKRVDSQLNQLPVGSYTSSYSMALADFNGDGHPDLAVISNYGIQIFAGDGTGSFSLRTTLSGTLVPQYIIASDINRDGKMDLIASYTGGSVSVFLGKGDGTFAAGAAYAAADGPSGTHVQRPLVVADFNNDGIPDVAVASGVCCGGASGQIAVYFGENDGTLTTPLVLPTTYFPDTLTAADMNRDGNVDLVFTGQDSVSFSQGTFTNRLYVMLGNGRGGFQSPVPVASGAYNSVQVADLNGDGIPDIAASSGNGNSWTWTVLLGLGDGSFTTPSTSTCTAYLGCQFPPFDFILADVNGDHKADLIFMPTTSGPGGTLAVTLNATQPNLSIITSTLPSGQIGEPYSQSIVATGGMSPYTWSLTPGSSLPGGLNLSSGGAITGTPTAVGTSTFSVQVSDSASVTVTQTFTLAITSGVLAIMTGSTLLPAASGLAFSQTLTATGGISPYSWSLTSGSLPSGLTLSTAGAISGTPTVAGFYSFSVKVTDSISATATQTFSLTVIATGTLARSGVLSHVTNGGYWDTKINLINTSSAPVSATVNLYADNGTAWNLPLTITEQGSTQTTTESSANVIINPNSTVVIATTPNPSATSVWGWADIDASGPLNGFAILRSTPTNDKPSEATVPLQTSFPSSLILPYDNTAGYSMGVALVNLATGSANLTATVWDDSGNQLGSQPISIDGNGHTAFVLTDQLSMTAGKRGIIQFQNPSGGVSSLGLRFSPAGPFTDVPVILP